MIKILTHSKFKFSVVKMIQKESVYLKSRKWRYINEDEESFIKINFEIIKKTINERKINGLIEDFKKVNLNDILENVKQALLRIMFVDLSLVK